jgi:hypothetical protein
MRIKRIHISHYGPIKELTMTPGNFELIFGLNEAGKTAVVEVLTYVLFKKTAVNLRYAKPDEVMIEMEDNGRVWTLPSKKSMTELPAGDVANLMYVRASDTGIFGHKGESSFWDGVKSLLSRIGSDASFTRLDENIFMAVGLQPRKEEWKREKQVEIENLTRRREELRSFLENIGSIGKKEAELARLESRRDLVNEKISVIEKHRAFKNHKELTDFYQTYEETAKSLQEYERYKYDYLSAWQKMESEKAARLEESKKLEAVDNEKKVLEQEYDVLQEKDARIEAEGLSTYVAQVEQTRIAPTMLLSVAAIAVAVIAVIASYLLRVTLLPSLVLLVGALLFFAYSVQRKNKLKRASADRQRYLNKATEIFPDAEDFTDVREQLKRLHEQKIAKKAAIDEKERLIEKMSSTRSLEALGREMAEIRAKTGLAEIGDLELKLSEKRQLEDMMNRTGASLTERLRESDRRKWEKMIQERKVVRPDSEPDFSAEKELREEQIVIQHRIESLERETRLFRDVQQAKSGVADDRAAFIEYESLSKKLSDYELEKEAALAARNILRDMSGELDEFIGGIMEGDSGLNAYFKAVTGRYPTVVLEKKNFVVIDGTGNKYAIENLSSGTQDQLLFCFRLAAVSKVYPDGAFMILDDAFIFADWERRQRLASLVRGFVEQGNQIMYFTSDDHTRDMFSACGARVTSLR